MVDLRFLANDRSDLMNFIVTFDYDNAFIYQPPLYII